MVAKLIRIGNSKGVRLPKALIEQAGLSDSIVITAQRDRLILQSKRKPREGWDMAFRVALADSGEVPMDRSWERTSNDFDESEWTW